jgi:hypothetical protein
MRKYKSIPLRSLVFILVFLPPSLGVTAACCGGGFSFPTLIVGDDRSQEGVSYSNGKIIDDILASGKWAPRQTNDLTQVLQFNGAMLISDRFQVGAALPLVRRSRTLNSGVTSSNGFGDATLDLGYEALPEWGYSWWRPKGLTFFQLTTPSGKSVYQSTDTGGTNVTGRGFWALGAGFILTKTFAQAWDAQFSFEGHRSFSRTIQSETAGGILNLNPGWGESGVVGGGWNYKNFRLGTSLSLNYEDPTNVTGVVNSKGGLQRYMTGVAMVSYLYHDNYSWSFVYSDQTLFGRPLNTTLSRTYSLVFQVRQPR